MSKGFEHNPLVDIERIRQDLKDRYPDDGGFVILKELIQNAEDAGAQRFVVSWTPGLPGARHPLLRGPAIVAANDGPFKESDRHAIRRLGLSDKLSERGSIGKFGLGLKSVFHWCEAFCYVFHAGEKTGGDILNPWSGSGDASYHPEWDDFGDAEVAQMRAALDGLLGPDLLAAPSWFSLWIPLRRKGVCAGLPCASLAPLRAVYPGDDGSDRSAQPPPFLQAPALPRRLADTLPLLVTLTRVHVRRPDGEGWVVEDVACSPKAQRRYRRGETEHRFTSQPIAGDIQLLAGVLTYRGRESLLAGEGDVARFRRSPLWPKGARENRLTGTVTDEPDKAGPHGAAVFVGPVGAPEADLEVSWATFLPLGEPLTRHVGTVDGTDSRVHLFLHGDFFVDPGRRGPGLPRPDAPVPDAPSTDAELHALWNRTLVQDAVLPNVLLALSDLCTDLEASTARRLTQKLVAAFANGELAGWRESLWTERQWAYRLGADATHTAHARLGAWALAPADQPLYMLPSPPDDCPELPWDIFAGFHAVTERLAITYAEWPRIGPTPDEPPAWPAPEIVRLIESVAAASLADAAHLSYLASVLPIIGVDAEDRVDAVTDVLVDLLRRAIHAVPLRVLEQHRDQLAVVLRAVGASRLLFVSLPSVNSPGEASIGRDRIARALATPPTRVLVLPRSRVSLADGASGTLEVGQTQLDDDDALALLRAIVGLQTDERPAARPVLISGLTTQIVQQIQSARIGVVLDTVADVPLIRAHGRAGDADTLVSWRAVSAARKQDLLFEVGTQQAGARDITEALQRVIGQAHVLRIDQDAAYALFRVYLPDCTPRSAAEAILTAGDLGSVEDRIPLLRLLLEDLQDSLTADSPLTSEDRRVQAVRYLLHGEPAQRSDLRPLLTLTDDHAQTTDAWEKLARAALMILDEHWRIVPGQLAGLAPQVLRKALALDGLGPDAVAGVIHEAGPKGVDCGSLDESERDVVLRDFPDGDDETLKRLPIHAVKEDADTLHRLTSLGPSTYLESSDFAIDSHMAPLITVIRASTMTAALARQRRIMRTQIWTDRATITVALGQSEPWRYAPSILRALADVRLQDLSSEHVTLLKSRPWLPLRSSGKGVAPADVLEIKGLEEQIAPIVAASDGLYADRTSLDPSVVGHQRFEGFVVPALLPGPPEVLTTLGQIIESTDALSTYHIGQVRLSGDTLDAYVDALRDLPTKLLTALPLIEQAIRCVSVEECAARLLPALQHPVAPDRLGRILTGLSEQQQAASPARRERIRPIFEGYLRALVAQAATTREGIHAHAAVVRNLRLLNAAGGWKPLDQLCPHDTHGLDASYVVDRAHGEILTPLLRLLAGSHPAEAGEVEEAGEVDLPTETDPTAADVLGDEASAEALRQYFEPWEARCPRTMIAGLVSLLGDGPIGDLAEHYFDRRGLTEVVRARLRWAPRVGVSPPGWAAEDHPRRVMATQRFAVSALDPQAQGGIPVRNLLGSIIHVPTAGRPEHLLVGDGLEHPLANRNIAQTRRTRLQLRRVSLDGLTEDDLKRLLIETGRRILTFVYLQPPACDQDYWKELGEGEQRDIGIAQIRLTKAIFTLVRQLGLAGMPELQETLQQWDAADRRLAELDDAETGDLRRQREQTEEDLRQLRRQLSERLSVDRALQQRILEAVRVKVQGHFQYQRASIPFELFQNADDAVVELAQMRDAPAHGAAEDGAAVRVVASSQGLTFFHWGRPINHFRHGDFDGRPRGFDADLEKMLTMTGSDKGRLTGVTGRFGLGFKSVFLLTDRPEVVSGRIAFDVVGGIYPRYLAAERHADLRRQLDDAGSSSVVGTVIHLPATADEAPSNAVTRFARLAHLLLVFARAIRRIELTTPQRRATVSWAERPLEGAPGVVVGSLRPFDEAPSRALVLRGSQGALLFALGRRGVEALPDDVPTIWVTAPTGEEARLGFAMNAPFQLDVGRAQLARDSEANRRIADTLGAELAAPLGALARATTADWRAAREALGLDVTTTRYEFWESIWRLGASGVRRRLDAGPEAEAVILARRLFWGTPEAALAALIDQHDLVPSGLAGDYQQLTRPDQIRFHLGGCLGADQRDGPHIPFGQIADWPGIRRQAPPRAVIDGEVASTLRTLAPTPRPYKALTLAVAVGWEIDALQIVGDRRLVSVDAARRLGKVVTRELLRRLRDSDAGSAHRLEDTALRASLAGLTFRAANGDATLVSEIVVGVQSSVIDNDDEHLRAAFAPQRYVLDASYASAQGADDVLRFLLTCRTVSQAPQATMELASRLATWIRDADEARRAAALVYLARGEHGPAVAAALVPDVQRTAWLRDLVGSHLFAVAGLNQWERGAVLAALHLEVQQLLIWPTPPRPIETLNVRESLENIATWWRTDRGNSLSEYLDQTFPGGQSFALSGDRVAIRQDEAVRKEWLKLFLLGATFTMGRPRRQQHRGFLSAWDQAGWLDAFARPHLEPSKILELLRDHLDRQVDAQQYYAWLRLFVPLFQVATWLDDYAGLFVQAARFDTPVQVATLLSPGVAPELSGTGIRAPALRRTLGIGACFVAREVARAGIGTGRGLDRLCYVPTGSVRWFMGRLGCDLLEDRPHVEGSLTIHDFLVDHLGEDGARFGGAFDIPLLIVAEDPRLQRSLLRQVLWDQGIQPDWASYDVQEQDLETPESGGLGA